MPGKIGIVRKTRQPSTRKLASAMDHDMPEVVTAHVGESLGESTYSNLTPDIEYACAASPEAEDIVNDRKDRQGVSVWYA
jgi:hypothetical protein